MNMIELYEHQSTGDGLALMMVAALGPVHGDVVRKTAHKWKPETRQKLYELAAMRTWSLKQHLQGKIRRSA